MILRFWEWIIWRKPGDSETTKNVVLDSVEILYFVCVWRTLRNDDRLYSDVL